MYELLKYIKLYKMLNTTFFFFFLHTTYRPDLSSKLWFYEIVCVEKICIFWGISCVYAKKCVSLQRFLKNTLNS